MTDTAPTGANLIAAVREHAEAHYNDGGWDVFVECFEDEDYARVIRDATTVKDAIANAADIAGIHADRQADARNSAF